jgi:hypothetical protein
MGPGEDVAFRRFETLGPHRNRHHDAAHVGFRHAKIATGWS